MELGLGSVHNNIECHGIVNHSSVNFQPKEYVLLSGIHSIKKMFVKIVLPHLMWLANCLIAREVELSMFTSHVLMMFVFVTIQLEKVCLS